MRFTPANSAAEITDAVPSTFIESVGRDYPPNEELKFEPLSVLSNQCLLVGCYLYIMQYTLPRMAISMHNV